VPTVIWGACWPCSALPPRKCVVVVMRNGLARGESVIKYKSPLNVLKDTYDYSCCLARSYEYNHLRTDSPGASVVVVMRIGPPCDKTLEKWLRKTVEASFLDCARRPSFRSTDSGRTWAARLDTKFRCGCTDTQHKFYLGARSIRLTFGRSVCHRDRSAPTQPGGTAGHGAAASAPSLT
jgi:hypothetical protein